MPYSKILLTDSLNDEFQTSQWSTANQNQGLIATGVAFNVAGGETTVNLPIGASLFVLEFSGATKLQSGSIQSDAASAVAPINVNVETTADNSTAISFELLEVSSTLTAGASGTTLYSFSNGSNLAVLIQDEVAPTAGFYELTIIPSTLPIVNQQIAEITLALN